ncbi:magnesium/cobalt transporter CorA [Silanimonas sp.]|uniref:magnesium/cobalt transporter CorA n=1 Tax=Silanimonas sp. TaxID=1929290 RepID=UPI0022C8740C|nr:magnesium/cobalt transporter CorA [Silanimonas sp.]MCZ8063701.1 magnesium/cobalt transporter CorA [Silanimonas sp.]
MSPVIPVHPQTRADMVRSCIHYLDGRKVADLELDAISDVLAVDDGSFVWVGLYEPDEELLHKLQEEFSLHPLAVEDALKAHQRPKIEPYGDALFIVMHTAQASANCDIGVGETHVFFGPRYLITVRHGASLPYAAARERAEQNPELFRLGPGYGPYAVLDYAVDNYFPIVEQYRQELETIEADIFDQHFKRDTIRRLYDLKRDLTTLRLAVSPLNDVLAQLTRFYPHLVRDELQVYFRDVQDHVARVAEATDTMREMLTAAMSVNLSLVAAEQGEVVKRLAGWAALLAVPTLVASWYGMNFDFMPETKARFGYPILVGGLVIAVLVLYRVLKKARWL